jgi:hypothetical protein
VFRDGQQSEYLALQRRELEVEGLHDFVVLDEFVARGETEQTQDLLRGWVGTTALLGIEREVLNVVAFHGETQLTLDEGLNEEAEKVEGE